MFFKLILHQPMLLKSAIILVYQNILLFNAIQKFGEIFVLTKN